MKMKKVLSADEQEALLHILKKRFDVNKIRHQGIDWLKVEAKLKNQAEKLWSLSAMENSGGEPDLVGYDSNSDTYTFFDCSAESPKGRRSICYDHKALDSRKEHKPANSALNMASEMGIEVLTEAQYRELQNFRKFDTKTSSWLKTPKEIRELGGALFGDFRYGKVFIYHNGAESYYGVRGFRGVLTV